MPNDDFDVSIDAGSTGNANLIYILYFVNFIVPLTGIVGLVMAYIGRADADAVTASHYNNQIGIFWKALLYSVVSILLTFIVIGFITGLVGIVWYIIRCVKGMQALGRGEAIANPGSWGF